MNHDSCSQNLKYENTFCSVSRVHVVFHPGRAAPRPTPGNMDAPTNTPPVRQRMVATAVSDKRTLNDPRAKILPHEVWDGEPDTLYAAEFAWEMIISNADASVHAIFEGRLTAEDASSGNMLLVFVAGNTALFQYLFSRISADSDAGKQLRADVMLAIRESELTMNDGYGLKQFFRTIVVFKAQPEIDGAEALLNAWRTTKLHARPTALSSFAAGCLHPGAIGRALCSFSRRTSGSRMFFSLYSAYGSPSEPLLSNFAVRWYPCFLYHHAHVFTISAFGAIEAVLPGLRCHHVFQDFILVLSLVTCSQLMRVHLLVPRAGCGCVVQLRHCFLIHTRAHQTEFAGVFIERPDHEAVESVACPPDLCRRYCTPSLRWDIARRSFCISAHQTFLVRSSRIFAGSCFHVSVLHARYTSSASGVGTFLLFTPSTRPSLPSHSLPMQHTWPSPLGSDTPYIFFTRRCT